jgi:hypothetical protein
VRVHEAAVDGQVDLAQGDHLQSGGSHHEVRGQLLAGAQPDAVAGEGVDFTRHY